METMRPNAAARLGVIESDMYKEVIILCDFFLFVHGCDVSLFFYRFQRRKKFQ